MRKYQSYRLFLRSLLLLLLVVILGDLALGSLLRHFYFKQRSGDNYRMIQSIEHTTADVLIFGSSRSTRHYRPDVLADSLGLTYYNTGKDGQDILYAAAVGKCVFSRYKPKLVILDIRRGEFRQGSYDRLSKLLPFYRTHPEIRPFIELRGPFEKIKLLSSVYPFNSEFFAILVTNTSFNEEKRKDDRGYLPLYKTWTKPLNLETSLLTTHSSLDPVRVEAFRAFVSDCRNRQIPMVVVSSPYYSLPLNPDSSLIVASSICREYQTIFLDISQDTSYLDHPEWFQDVQHLNQNGALRFSENLVALIRENIPELVGSR
ncbi:MAG: hypothetical protein U0T82_16125 [Bacteroidales bacterium]